MNPSERQLRKIPQLGILNRRRRQFSLGTFKHVLSVSCHSRQEAAAKIVIKCHSIHNYGDYVLQRLD